MAVGRADFPFCAANGGVQPTRESESQENTVLLLFKRPVCTVASDTVWCPLFLLSEEFGGCGGEGEDAARAAEEADTGDVEVLEVGSVIGAVKKGVALEGGCGDLTVEEGECASEGACTYAACVGGELFAEGSRDACEGVGVLDAEGVGGVVEGCVIIRVYLI